ncbi:MAG: TlpA family protein disulfide reductase [Acidimicrobiia bacterium]
MRTIRLAAALLTAVFLITACSSGPEPLAFIASSGASIGTGEQRILIALVDPETNAYLATENDAATALLRNEDGSPLGNYELDFVWTVPGVRGIYVGYFEIPEAGVYQLTVEREGLTASGPTGFVTVDNPPMIGPGDRAPLSETRVGDDFADLSLITTDPQPASDLYSMTVAEAVSNGTPSVVIFATPAFCTTQACGPMLSQIKDLKFDYPGIDFVHVEIYENLQVETVEELVVVDSVREWQLPSEPWVYIIDADGVVVAAFEGAVNDDELTSVLDGFAGS